MISIEPALERSPVAVRAVWETADPIVDPSVPDWLDRTVPHSRGVQGLAGANLFFPEGMPDVIAEEARRLWAVG